MAKSSPSSSKQTNKPRKAAQANPSQSYRGRRSSHEPILDSRRKNDIWGVLIIVVGVVLFVAAILPSDAVVTAAVSEGLHLAFGIGCYILPVFVVVVGASFLINTEVEPLAIRVSLGLLVIFIALLGVVSLFSPAVQTGMYTNLFLPEVLKAYGGYLGCGIAYAGASLLGPVVSMVILIGLVVVGFIIIGLSISRLLQRLRERVDRGFQQQLRGEEAPQFARVSAGAAQVDEGLPPVDPASPTISLRRRTGGQPSASEDTEGVASSGSRASAAKARNAVDNEAPTIAFPENDPHTADTIVFDDADAVTSAGRKPARAAMTRKLGKHSKDEPAGEEPEKGKKASDDVLSRIKKMPVLPLAAPTPLEGFELPPYEILSTAGAARKSAAIEQECKQTAELLQETLEDFGVLASVVGWVAGPTVTLYKVDLPHGVRVSKITALNDDIALALATPGIRIFAPIPGTNFVGIEVPNKTRESVLLGDVLKKAGKGPLQMAIGKDVDGNCVVADLAAMPHLLIGGTTGSGKTIAIHSMIISILMRSTPSEVRFIMIDPKRVEFMRYNGIPHLYVPVVTEAREAASALNWGVAEMERRLKLFSKTGASNIGQYNAKVQNGLLDDEGAVQVPYIVIIIDELADLMMNCGKEVEFSISRIAQLARAAGIHLIVATQRPSANVVTGLIKANITNRIALTVASSIDSRVILDSPGAESLIGKGDMLLSKPEYPKPMRLQGCFVSDEETYAVVEFIKEQGEPDYHSEILQTNLITLGQSAPDGSGGTVEADDPLLWEAADIVVSNNLGSTSNIQRRLKVGYARAGRIMDMLEEKGVVGPQNGSKPREVLVDAVELESLKAFEMNDD